MATNTGKISPAKSSIRRRRGEQSSKSIQNNNMQNSAKKLENTSKNMQNKKKIKLKDSDLTIEQISDFKKSATLRVRDKIVYPGHGVGTIESIVERKIGDITTKFYSVHLENSDLRLFIPCDSAQVKSLRKIIGPVEVKAIFEMLKKRKKSKTDLESWNRRVREYLEIVKNCDVFELASLLSEFKAIMKAKALSFGEKRIFDTAKNLLATELSLALGKPVGALSTELDKMLGVPA